MHVVVGVDVASRSTCARITVRVHMIHIEVGRIGMGVEIDMTW